MIQVTLTFKHQSELLAFFAGTGPLPDTEAATVAESIKPIEKAVVVSPKPKAEKTAAVAKAAPVPTPAETAPIEPTAAAEAEAQAVVATAKTTSAVALAVTATLEAAAAAPAPALDYKVLQSAVFTLAGLAGGKDSARALVAKFGVATFKELPAAKWQAALDAVNADIAYLSSEPTM